MDQKRQHRLDAGSVSDRFPDVAGIIINMTYYQRGANPILMERTINIFPSSDAYFKMDCMIKGCEDGGFDLTSVVRDMAKTRKRVRKGTLVCRGNTDAAPDHASVDYEVVMQYKRASH